MGTALGGISALVADEDAQARLLRGEQETVLRLAAGLAVMNSCSFQLERLGAPPSARLAEVRAELAQACRRYEQGADRIARGVDANEPTLILQAATALDEGNELIERANARLRALAGNDTQP